MEEQGPALLKFPRELPLLNLFPYSKFPRELPLLNLFPYSKFLEEQVEEEDRISKLPDEILCKILSYLPTKQAVATAILSSRWSDLWTWLPSLDFNDDLFLHIENRRKDNDDVFIEFVSRILRLSCARPLQKLTLNLCFPYYDNDHSYVDLWIETAISRNVSELDLDISMDDTKYVYYELPRAVFTCRSLVKLRFHWNTTLHFPPPPYPCFPSLKVLSVDLSDPDPVFIANLFCGCPVLEDLSIHVLFSDWFDSELSFNITSLTLKRLKIVFEVMGLGNIADFNVLIQAPKLEQLFVEDDLVLRYKAKGLVLLDEAVVDVGNKFVYATNNPIHLAYRPFELLRGLCYVKSLTLHPSTLMALNRALDDDDDDIDVNVDVDVDIRERCMELIPTFHRLTYLKLYIPDYSGWMALPYLLEGTPYLEVLVLEKMEVKMRGFIINTLSERPPQFVPKCLLHHLKAIEIKGFKKRDLDLSLIKFFLENSKVLQRMTIDIRNLPNEILKLKRGSEACCVQFF